jgi:hypothetical protein
MNRLVKSRLVRRGGTLSILALLGSSVLATIAILSVASGTPEFGGADRGVEQAASTGLATSGGDSATREGITIRVTGVIADDTRTVIGLTVDGRPELGPGVLPASQAQLVNQDGTIYREVGGTADSINPRLITRYYPPLAPASRSLSLQINGLEFVDRQAGSLNPGAAARTRIDAQWILDIQLQGPPLVSADAAADHDPVPFGPGEFVVDSVKQAPTGTVIAGHLVGFAMDVIPELGLGAVLVDSRWNESAITGMRLGFGEFRELVEIRFPRLSGAVTLRVSGAASPYPHDAAAAQQLASGFASAAPAEWTFTLPE